MQITHCYHWVCILWDLVWNRPIPSRYTLPWDIWQCWSRGRCADNPHFTWPAATYYLSGRAWAPLRLKKREQPGYSRWVPTNVTGWPLKLKKREQPGYSTVTLSYRSLWYLKCTLSYRLAALQHIPCLHSTFDGYGASLQHQQQHQLMSLNRLCVLFLFPLQFRYRCIQNLCNILPTKAHN